MNLHAGDQFLLFLQEHCIMRLFIVLFVIWFSLLMFLYCLVCFFCRGFSPKIWGNFRCAKGQCSPWTPDLSTLKLWEGSPSRRTGKMAFSSPTSLCRIVCSIGCNCIPLKISSIAWPHCSSGRDPCCIPGRFSSCAWGDTGRWGDKGTNYTCPAFHRPQCKLLCNPPWTYKKVCIYSDMRCAACI